MVEELLEELMEAPMFFKIDLKSSYLQVKMALGEEFKTASRTHNDHYEFLVMPFRLTNASPTFKSLINEVFKVSQEIYLNVFFYNIPITGIKHINNIQENHGEFFCFAELI